jgi:hypothetical protein
VSLFAYLNGSDVAQSIRLNDFGLTTKADGHPGVGGIVFDDPVGTLNVRGWMTVLVKETACTTAPVLFDGFIFDRAYSRSNGSVTYRQGKSRFINSNLQDENAVMHTRLITGLDGKRPAETRDERIQWLLGSAYLSGLIDDTSLVSSGAENFEEASYLGQYADDVLADVLAPINRIFFLYTTQPDGGRGLFVDRATETIATSTLTISNVLADITYDTTGVTGTTFPPLIDAVLTRDPTEVYSNGRYTYKNGVVLGHNDDTQAEFFADNEIGSRGIQIDNSRVGQESTARTFLGRILDRDSTEDDTIAVTIQVPPDKAGLVQAGDRIGVRFQHLELEGYYDPADWVYTRVITKIITHAPDNDQLYNIELELNTKGLPGGGGGGAPGPGTFPNPPSANPNIVQTKTEVVGGQGSGDFSVTLDQAPTEGNVLVLWQDSRGVNFGTPPTGWTVHPAGVITPGSDFARMMYRTVAAGETAEITVLTGSEPGGYSTVWEITGVETTPDDTSSDVVDTITMPASVDAGTLTPTASVKAIALMGLAIHCSDAVGGQVTFIAPGSGFTQDAQPWADAHPLHYAAHQNITSTTGSYATTQGLSGFSSNFAGWGGEAMIFIASAAVSNPPAPGQWVYNETPTPAPGGGVVTFFTANPFSDGSLSVFVDLVDQTAAITSYDGAAGSFTLAFDPRSWETLIVQYQGR